MGSNQVPSVNILPNLFERFTMFTRFHEKLKLSLLRTMEKSGGKIRASEIYSLFYKCVFQQMNYVITQITNK